MILDVTAESINNPMGRHESVRRTKESIGPAWKPFYELNRGYFDDVLSDTMRWNAHRLIAQLAVSR